MTTNTSIFFSHQNILRHAPRLLFGFVFAASGLSKLLAPQEILMQSYGTGTPFMSSLQDTGYLFVLLAITEIITGLAILINRFVPLALTILAPIIINIVGFHLFVNVNAGGIVVALVVLVLELYLAWQHHDAFAPLLRAGN